MASLDNFHRLLSRWSKPKDEKMPEFRILVLGTRAAGKTVFLASLYRKLCVNDPLQQYYLSCERKDQEKDLQNTYRAVADPSSDWPPSTQNVTEYSFLATHILPDGNVTLFKVTYVDFPGGYVDDPLIDPEAFSLKETARNWDSILVLLDGQKIKDFLDGRENTIFDDLNALLPVVNEGINRKESKPIHFAITKSDLISDLIDDQKFDEQNSILGMIAEKLLKHDLLRNFVETQLETQRERNPELSSLVSLIPVSAVGHDFATYDGKKITKRKDGVPNPYNVQLSIGMTIRDHLDAEYRKLQSDDQRRGRKRLEDWARSSEFLRGFVNKLPYGVIAVESWGPPLPVIAYKIAHLLASVAENTLDKEIERAQNKLKRANDRSSALEGVLAVQTLLSQQFREKLPRSDLGKAVPPR